MKWVGNRLAKGLKIPVSAVRFCPSAPIKKGYPGSGDILFLFFISHADAAWLIPACINPKLDKFMPQLYDNVLGLHDNLKEFFTLLFS